MPRYATHSTSATAKELSHKQAARHTKARGSQHRRRYPPPPPPLPPHLVSPSPHLACVQSGSSIEFSLARLTRAQRDKRSQRQRPHHVAMSICS